MVDDYFSGEMQEFECPKCGKIHKKLTTSMEDHSTEVLCDACRKSMSHP